MASDNFVDYVKIHCSSGNGGAGSTHFRREKYIPMGGPDGGDGGRGGHVIVRGNSQLWTLLHLKFKKHVKASHGAHGAGNLKTGSQGTDEIIDVPTICPLAFITVLIFAPSPAPEISRYGALT